MKPELDNSSIHRQQSNAGMSQPQQFIKTEGDGGANTANMPALSPLSGADLNLTASSPATEALELLNDDPNVMFDLNEMLKRDPTLSALVKEEPGTGGGQFAPHPQPLFGMQVPQQILIEQAANRGMPIPRRDIGGIEAGQSASISSQPFGDGSSAGSNMGTSPGLQPAAPMAIQVSPTTGVLQQSILQLQPQQNQQQYQPEMKMDTMDALQPTLAQLNSPGSNENSNSLSAMKVEHDFDVDFNDYFTNSSSRDVSFGLGFNNKTAPQRGGQQPVAPATAAAIRQQIARNSAPAALQLQQQQQQQHQMPFALSPQPPSTVAAGEELLFTNSSFTTHTGGAIFTSSAAAALSSSVPVTSVLVSSPLQDILNELPPTSPPEASTSAAGGLSPSQAGPDRSHGANSTLHKLLLTRNDPVAGRSRPSPVRSPENKKTLEKLKSSLSASNPLLSQQLSRSAPMATPGGRQQQVERALWARREPRQHISSVCSVGEGSGSIADEVSEALSGISPNDLPDIESDDEDDDSDDDRTQEDDSDEDDDGDGSSAGKSSKKERYFWQYNVQAKGPKGQKIVVETKMEDPHVLNDIVDPVFSGDVKLQGIKHSGKARRGDGNDLTADPRKLAAIGRELDQLGSTINDLTPVSEMPFNHRCKSRKEKNKLASRACRLKKKAQHEANKLKCMGLAEEHHLLNDKLERAREIMRAKIDPNNTQPQSELSDEMEVMARKAQKHLVAGKTTEYVNKMIEKHMK